MKEKARKPDYNLWAIIPDETSKGKIGAAWINDDDSIFIKLNPFIVLSQIENPTIKLFPNDDKYEERQAAKKEKAEKRPPPPSDLEDDIPF